MGLARKKNIAHAVKLGLCLISLLLVSCRTNEDWNPFVDLSQHDTIVVLDLRSDDPRIGKTFADQIASEFIREGRYAQVLRSLPEKPALVLEGELTRYVPGNVPLRIKTQGRAGQSHIHLSLTLTEHPSTYRATETAIHNSTQNLLPDAKRTGREDIYWLRLDTAQKIARRFSH